MKNIILLILALSVVIPVSAADDDEFGISKVEAVEVLAPEKLPVITEAPSILAYEYEVVVSEEEPIGCWKETREESIQTATYLMVVGLAMELPAQWTWAGGMIGGYGTYGWCKIKRIREKRRAES